MNAVKNIIFYSLFLLFISVKAQNKIPTNKVVAINDLAKYLKKDYLKKISAEENISEAKLAEYFREKFSERFFYDWKTFEPRFKEYTLIYDNASSHKKRAQDHMQKYADSTNWKLPFNYLNGEKVNAYALRHLARQHKMVDIAFEYYNSGKDSSYITYFTNQMVSLNTALAANKFETIDSGNGVYEVFRSGYRILNWLTIHNMFLGEKAYSDKDQLTTIATLLQHAQDLYENNQEFKSGNHQTRGMSALAMLSILFRDFEGSDLWYKRSMQRLEEHLVKEVNEDGFQFERSVHYHMSDIETYFYVYQLAQRSNIEVSSNWKNKLESLFTTLVKIAYPDKSAPVLQDDTDIPWAEKNDISGAITLGYLLFNNPEYGYLAKNKVKSFIYWFLNKKQVDELKSIKTKQPTYGSLMFPDTKYYIMREGWSKNDKMLIISNGVDKEKPDHQHGDVLGIQAMANGNVILPNYQVRYSLKDFDLFKNSMVKNVALVDDELIGKEWTSNRGGSGFGKFKNLPVAKTICWKSNTAYDFFTGTHNGFKNIDVNYFRQVIFIKNDFWIVKDNFTSNNSHTYKQIWQGHYTQEEGANLLRANFPDATGLDILQLNKVTQVTNNGKRGKQWSIVSKNDVPNFNFITVLFPYNSYNNRIDETSNTINLNGWNVNKPIFNATGDNLQSISKEKEAYLFNTNSIQISTVSVTMNTISDIYTYVNNNEITIKSISHSPTTITISGSKKIKLNGEKAKKELVLQPGEEIKILIK